jgi:hypothetical protein
MKKENVIQHASPRNPSIMQILMQTLEMSPKP